MSENEELHSLSQKHAEDVFLFDDEDFDPLAVDDEEINQEDMDDDNPLDTVDFPTVRNMPEELRSAQVYVPERQGGAQNAMLNLIDHNPARRPVLLSILKWCENGCANSELTAKVDEAQENNRSVYSSTTLCRMLERAGGLTLEMPEPAKVHEDVSEGVQYMEISERIDPVWTTTADGMEVYESLHAGATFNDIVLNRDLKYIEVYRAVMNFVNEAPRTKKEIEDLVDNFEVVQHPRRFGGHFIDMLERSDALEWKNHAWQLTDLGKEMIPKVEAAYTVTSSDAF